MANIINKDYFYGRRLIAQVTEPSVLENLNQMIAELEPKILTCLLGSALYADLKTAYDASVLEVDPVALPAKFNQLLNGVDYFDKYGTKQHWIGLIESTSKRSLIANYVYFYWHRDNASLSTGTGEKSVDAENAKPAPVIYKQNDAWNEMVGWNKQCRLYLSSNTITFENWADPLQRPVYGGCKDIFHTNNNLNF